MKVSACVVTRGDHPLDEVVGSIPASWEKVIYDNSGRVRVVDAGEPVRGGGFALGVARTVAEGVPDLAVYGRYQAALEHATNDVIYVQDDDCVVTPEGFKIITAAFRSHERLTRDAIVCNMPPQFRHDFYEEHALVGFGAIFERRLAAQAFARFDEGTGGTKVGSPIVESPWFRRTCDVVFTALNERILVDAPVENLPWASGPDRMWRQPTHVGERTSALRLALAAKVAA